MNDQVTVRAVQSYFKVWWAWMIFFLIVLSVVSPIFALIFVVGGLGIVSAFKYPRAFVFFFAVYTVFEETLLRWLPSSARYVGEVGIVTLLALVVLKQVLGCGRIRYRRTAVTLPLVLFLLIATISTLLNQVPLVVAILGIRPWLRYLLLFYLVILLDWPPHMQRRLVYTLLAVAVIEALIGLVQSVGGAGVASWFAAPIVTVDGRIVQQITPGLIGAKIFGTLARYDRFGNYLMLMFLLGLALWPIVRSRQRPKLLVALGIIALAASLSFSRQAWLGMGVGILLITLIDKRRRTMLFLGLALLFLPFIFVLGEAPTQSTSGGNPATVLTRMLEPFSPQYWQSVTNDGGRVYYVAVVGPKLLEGSPWFGFGPGRFGSLVTRLYPTSVYEQLGVSNYFASNFSLDIQWMAMLGQVGILGVAAFLWLFARVVLLSYREYSRLPRYSWPRALALALLAWSAGLWLITFLGPNLEIRVVSLNFWLLAALVQVNRTLPVHRDVR